LKLSKSELQLETVISRINAGEIDLQPNFQRGEIWDLKRKQRLVDTILRDWYVPAVHIVVDSDGEEVVLDGQQRLATIRDFVADKIRISGTTDPPSDAIAAMNGKRFSELPVTVQKAVNRFVIQVITLTEFEPQEPNELFFRLNQSYNLTPPEKRNALHGQARNQVKDLVASLTETGLLERSVVGFSNGRLAYDDIVARVCVALEQGSLRRHINNNVVEEYYRTRVFAEPTLTGLSNSGQLLLDLVRERHTRVKFNKGTLQTWLVYCYWAPATSGDVPSGILHEFEERRLAIRSGDRLGIDPTSLCLTEVLKIYDDRASYRVTDVSSVLARDLAIHLFSQMFYGTPGRRGSGHVVETMMASSPDEVPRLFFDYLDESDWGNPILSDQGDQ